MLWNTKAMLMSRDSIAWGALRGNQIVPVTSNEIQGCMPESVMGSMYWCR